MKFNFKKILTIGAISLATITSSFVVSTKDVNAHNAYFVSITIDEAAYRYVPTITYDKSGALGKHIEQTEIGTVSKNPTIPSVSYSDDTDENTLKEAYKGVIDQDKSPEVLTYSFPPVHGSLFSQKVNANGDDEMLANRFADYVVKGLNDALSFVISESNSDNSLSISEFRNYATSLANKQSFSVNGVNFTITSFNPEKTLDGLEPEDYVKVTSSTGNYIVVPYQVRKGYKGTDKDGNRERGGLNQKYLEQVDSEDVEKLSWIHVVLQGNFNADVNGATFSSLEEIIKPSQLVLAINSIFDGLYYGLKSLLGLYNIEELMLNSGVRESNYWYGIMPKSWLKASQGLHVICQFVAWSFIGFSIVRMLLKRQLQTMNIGERISLMEGFKNLILTSALLGLTPLLFPMIAKANIVLVDLFASSSQFSNGLKTSVTTNASGIASVIINLAFLFLSIYYNAIYVLRGATISILYAISPLCIYSLSLGGKRQQVFSNFLRELSSQMFIQTFHAISLAFFTTVTATAMLSSFELFIVLLSLIPITKLMQETIFGSSGGLEGIAKGVTATSAMTASGISSSLIGNSSSSKGSSRSSFGGGGGDGSPMSTEQFYSPKTRSAMSNNSVIPTPTGNSMFMTGGGISKNDLTISNSELLKDTEGNSHLGNNSNLVYNSGKNFGESVVNGIKNTSLGGKAFDKIEQFNEKISNSNVGMKASEIGNKISNTQLPNGSTLGETVPNVTSKVGEGIVKNVGNVTKNAAKITGNAGMAFGSMMIDDKMGTIRNTGNITKNMSDLSNNMVNPFKSSDNNQSQEEMYGIGQIYDGGEHMTNIYKADVDDDGNINFENEYLNDTQYKQDVQEMYNAFNRKGDYAQGGSKEMYRDAAVNHYKKAGINRVGKKDGKLAINFNKNLSKKRDFTFKDVAITPYEPPIKPSNAKTV